MRVSEFDRYAEDFETQIDRSIAFSGLTERYFTECKAEHILELIRGSIGAAETANVLDVGCGTGRLHGFLNSRVGGISGTDVSQDCLDRASNEQPEAEYRLFDGRRLPFNGAAYDISFAVNVFHHVRPADRQVIVNEMARVTRPGGVVAIFEHNPFNPLTRLSVARCEFDADAVLLTSGESRRLIREAGCAEVASRYITFLPVAPRRALLVDRAAQVVALGSAIFCIRTGARRRRSP